MLERNRNPLKYYFCLLFSIFLTGCGARLYHCPVQISSQGKISKTQLLQDFHSLASDEMAGRLAGTKSGKKAAKWIAKRFEQIELAKFENSYFQSFLFKGNKQGRNVVGWEKGKIRPEKFIVITAHFDHLGKTNSKIFNGADDNASGVAGLIALAEYFKINQPKHSIIFVATDAEEAGLFGAKHFIENPPVALDAIILNINLDMIARGEKKNRLYVAGTKRNAVLKKIVKGQIHQSQVCLIAGHEGKSLKRLGGTSDTNWDNASDHAPFNKRDIPYLYFGVDLHRDYHQTSDTSDKVDEQFYTAAVETILHITDSVDRLVKTPLTETK